MRASTRLITLLISLALCFLAIGVQSQGKKEQPKCQSVVLSIALNKGESYQKRIGELTFKMQPLESSGWAFSLEDSKGADYIYPVNPPLRFNGSQTLGMGYGETARQSLSSGRELRFLLNRADYDTLQPVLTDALWPYSAKDPDHAADRYVTMLDRLPTGLLRLTILNDNISQDDKVNSASFKVEFITPTDFKFDSSLAPQSKECPSATSSAARLSR